MSIFPKKDPAERVVLTFDFSADLDAGETVASIESVTVSMNAGSDLVPGDILNGPAAIDSSQAMVLVPVKDGVSGYGYRIKVVINTSNSKRLSITAVLPIGIQP